MASVWLSPQTAVPRMWKRLSPSAIGDGEWVIQAGLSASQAAAFYLDMELSGTLPLVFYESSPDIRWFLDWMAEPNTYTMSAWRVRPDPDVPFLAGVGFVNRYRNMGSLVKAEVGFAFTNRMGADTSIFQKIQLVRGMITGVFTMTDVDAIHGVTPDRNEAAVALIRRVGMRLFGPVPNYTTWNGQPCGVYLSEADKETWFNKHPLVC